MKQHPLCTDTEHVPDVMDLASPGGIEAGMGRLCRRAGTFSAARERCWDGRRWPACSAIAVCAETLIRPDVRQARSASADALKLPHFAPKAKRAIYLFMSGGPSQVDLLDYKPNLAALYDKDIPDSVRGSTAVDRHDHRAGAVSHCAFALGIQALRRERAPG